MIYLSDFEKSSKQPLLPHLVQQQFSQFLHSFLDNQAAFKLVFISNLVALKFSCQSVLKMAFSLALSITHLNRYIKTLKPTHTLT